MPIPAFLTAAGKAIGTAALGGLTSGISKRIEAQVGGEKAARYGATGYEGSRAIDRHHFADTQFRSQGQQQAAGANLQYNAIQNENEQRRLQRAHERSMLQMSISANGQSDTGQVPWWAIKAPDRSPPPRRSTRPATQSDARRQYLNRLQPEGG